MCCLIVVKFAVKISAHGALEHLSFHENRHSVASTLLMSINYNCVPGSSVGIATDYGLDGPGSNPSGDEIFRPSRPALGPTQPPVKWIPSLSWG